MDKRKKRLIVTLITLPLLVIIALGILLAVGKKGVLGLPDPVKIIIYNRGYNITLNSSDALYSEILSNTNKRLTLYFACILTQQLLWS